MKEANILTFFAASCLIGLVRACGFHGSSFGSNVRRSQPGNCTKTLIEHVQVFDGDSFTGPRSICLDDGLIIPEADCSDAISKVNGLGKYLIPGLIDSHNHLSSVEAVENFTSYGCTTALLMNYVNYTLCDTLSSQDPTRPNDTVIYPYTNVVQFVQYQFDNGSDFMKITAEPHGPSQKQQVEMVATTHALYNKQTMTHASAIMPYLQAVASKTDGIQHLPCDGVLNVSTIQQILDQGQFVTPTINIFRYGFAVPQLHPYFGLVNGSNQSLAHVRENVQLLFEAGVPMIAGTDAVGPDNVGDGLIDVPFGITLHYELQNLVEFLGISPARAINMATRDAAYWHRLHDRGSIDIGKRADLVMLNSDPLSDITNTLDIDSIWVGGIPYADVAVTPPNVTTYSNSTARAAIY